MFLATRYPSEFHVPNSSPRYDHQQTRSILSSEEILILYPISIDLPFRLFEPCPKFRHPPLSISPSSRFTAMITEVSASSVEDLRLPWRLRVGVGAPLNQPRPRRS